ncbi:MAG: hypothetical protein ACR2N2_05890 [Acidimicrobiia bacterium]
MSDHNPVEPLVAGTKKATVHFAKAAFEVAAGVGALFTGVTRTVSPADDEDEGTGPQKVELE